VSSVISVVNYMYPPPPALPGCPDIAPSPVKGEGI